MSLDEQIAEADLIGRRLARIEMEKTSSLADAILGAPVGAIAARIAAPEESKAKATAYGLVIGALMGWSAGQRSVYEYLHGKDPNSSGPKQFLKDHPFLSIAAAGGAIGGAMRVSKALKSSPGSVVPANEINAPEEK